MVTVVAVVAKASSGDKVAQNFMNTKLPPRAHPACRLTGVAAGTVFIVIVTFIAFVLLLFLLKVVTR